MMYKFLFCIIVLILSACGDDSTDAATGKNPDYDYWLNQENFGAALAKPCNVDGVNNCEYGVLEDARDGQVYKTIAIGDQVWMAENLNFAAHNSFCVKKDNCKGEGRLYTFGTIYDTSSTHCVYDEYCDIATPIQGVCPSGWHVPELEEWNELFSNVGKRIFLNVLLKDSAWGNHFPYHDAYGFALKPSPDQSAFSIKEAFFFLAYSHNESLMPAYRTIYYSDYVNSMGDYGYFLPLGLSVRCLQDKAGSAGTKSQMVAEVETRTKAWDYLNPAIEYGTLEDARDGQVYKTVEIGEDTWMAQNLNYNMGDGRSFCYDDYDAFCEKFGRIYTRSALSSADLCPAGWHVSTRAEWEKLKNLSRGKNEYWYARLLAKDAWYFPNSDDEQFPADMNDDYGFSMLPAGNLYTITAFAEDGDVGYGIYTHSRNVGSQNDSLVSIRCVKNQEN